MAQIYYTKGTCTIHHNRTAQVYNIKTKDNSIWLDFYEMEDLKECFKQLLKLNGNNKEDNKQT